MKWVTGYLPIPSIIFGHWFDRSMCAAVEALHMTADSKKPLSAEHRNTLNTLFTYQSIILHKAGPFCNFTHSKHDHDSYIAILYANFALSQLCGCTSGEILTVLEAPDIQFEIIKRRYLADASVNDVTV